MAIIDAFELSIEEKKWLLFEQRHNKVILQHDNAKLHVAKLVKTYLEMLKCEVIPQLPYSPDIATSNYHLSRLMAYGLAEQYFHSYEDTKKWVDLWLASKDVSFFHMEFKCCQKDGKKIVARDGQYFQ